MSVLYIIGNGFDLHNRLKTCYSHFHEFVIESFPDLENDFEEYFSLEVNEKFLWKNFESNLSTYNYQNFFDSYNNIDIRNDNFKRSEAFGLEDEIVQEANRLVNLIREAFTEWISKIDCKVLPIKQLYKGDEAFFINFNYTDTLEHSYGISNDKILYIHGKAHNCEELIFGHGQPTESNPTLEELDENGDSNRTLFTDSENASRYPFYVFKKPTNEIIGLWQEFFSKLKEIDVIFVLGHSLGEVDQPYFKEISELLPNAKWSVSYYENEEKVSLLSIAKEMLNKDVEMIKIESLEQYL